MSKSAKFSFGIWTSSFLMKKMPLALPLKRLHDFMTIYLYLYVTSLKNKNRPLFLYRQLGDLKPRCFYLYVKSK